MVIKPNHWCWLIDIKTSNSQKCAGSSVISFCFSETIFLKKPHHILVVPGQLIEDVAAVLHF